MSRVWIRRESTSQEALASGLVALTIAAAAGAAAWYLTRTFLSRDSISLRPDDGNEIEKTSIAGRLADGSSRSRLPEPDPAGDALG